MKKESNLKQHFAGANLGGNGTWADCVDHFSILEWERSQRQLEEGHGGSIYTTEIGKCYETELPCLSSELDVKHLPAYHLLQGKLNEVFVDLGTWSSKYN